jgi:putative transposase
MLTDEEFSIWCQRNHILSATEMYLQRIRSSEPVRRVRGRASNVSGRYPSVKMGCSIQFESQVEFLAIYAMERDDDVLEYYDQPTRIQLHYRSLRGQKTSPWHTPDFLVIRRNGAGFEEWKPENALEGLTKRMPERYQSDPRGGWRCPPGELAASDLGLTYRVRTSGEYHPQYIQNLKFLQNFWTHPFSVSQQAEQQVRDALAVYPGISVDALLQAYSDLVVDVVWATLTTQSIFTDLTATSLMDWEHVFLYASASEVEVARQARGNVHPNLPIVSPLIIDGRLWEIDMQEEQVLLRPEVGVPFSLPVEQFRQMQASGLIVQVSFSTPSPLSEVARARIAKASPKSQEAANKRWREILAYARGDALTVTTRSVQNWMAAYRQAEADLGCGYTGLLDRVAERGNRSPRVPDASKELLKAYFTTHYQGVTPVAGTTVLN